MGDIKVSDHQRLMQRAARSHLATVANEGGGPSFLPRSASPAPPAAKEPAATPLPPKWPHPEFPSARVADISKNSEKKIPEKRNCAGCFYWFRKSCRAEPPKLTATPYGTWPTTAADDWCGDWLDVAIREGVEE